MKKSPKAKKAAKATNRTEKKTKGTAPAPWKGLPPKDGVEPQRWKGLEPQLADKLTPEQERRLSTVERLLADLVEKKQAEPTDPQPLTEADHEPLTITLAGKAAALARWMGRFYARPPRLAVAAAVVDIIGCTHADAEKGEWDGHVSAFAEMIPAQKRLDGTVDATSIAELQHIPLELIPEAQLDQLRWACAHFGRRPHEMIAGALYYSLRQIREEVEQDGKSEEGDIMGTYLAEIFGREVVTSEPLFTAADKGKSAIAGQIKKRIRPRNGHKLAS